MCFVTLEVTTKKFCLKRSNICSRFEAYSDLGNRTLAFRLLVTTRCQVLAIDHWLTGQLTGHRQVKTGSVAPPLCRPGIFRSATGMTTLGVGVALTGNRGCGLYKRGFNPNPGLIYCSHASGKVTP